MKRSMRKGFTLVELLIVIVVIGILSAMMMLSSTEAVSSARAAQIISDLRNLKTAALAWYADNLDYVEGRYTPAGKTPFANIVGMNFNNLSPDILKYLGNQGINGKWTYSFCTGHSNISQDLWYVLCDVTNDARVKEKLGNRAKSVGLLASGEGDMTNPEQPFTGKEYYHNYVAMRIK